MIPITKAEKERLEKAFPTNRPPYHKFPRTMKQDSKRHHYFCTENEALMRCIADTNDFAAELVREYDRRNAAKRARNRANGGGRTNGSYSKS